MTPEHKFTLWATALAAVPTIVFTGAAAFWSWRRDQERIIVQKSPTHWKTLDGAQTKETLCGAGIVVTNLSLWPVRIAGLAFRIDEKLALLFDRDEHIDEWPLELASRARMKVYCNDWEWKQLENLGVRDKIMDWTFIAVAATETGGRFSSNRPIVRILRLFRRSKW